jgi:hypothetical protein
MKFSRVAIAATFLIGCAVPLAAAPGVAASAPAVSRASSKLCAPPADTVAPAVTRVTFGRKSIDLDSGSRVQTIRATASDTSGHGAASGVARVNVVIESGGYARSLDLRLTSGTATSGHWTRKFAVSRYVSNERFWIEDLTAYDAAGNHHYYPSSRRFLDSPSALSLNPADNPKFTVTGKTQPYENAGRLTSFTLSRTKVNPTRSVQRIRAGATFAGNEPKSLKLLVGTVPRNRPDVHDLDLTIAMERHHGAWSGVVRVPPGIGSQVLRPVIQSTFGARTDPTEGGYDWHQLHDLGFPSKITVVSRRDTTAPHITSLDVVRHPMSEDGAMRVTLTAKATDTGSGVHQIGLAGHISGGVNGAPTGDYYLNGYGYLSHYYFLAELKKTTGNTWVGDLTFRPCLPSGTYRLRISVADFGDNFSTIRRTVDVTTKHGDTFAPWITTFTYGTTTPTLRLDFTEGVANVNTSTLTLYRLSPRETRYQTPTKITAITCTHGAKPVACDGSDPNGLVESATLTVPDFDSSYGTGYELWANQHQVTPQLVDGNGNPMSPDHTPNNPAA